MKNTAIIIALVITSIVITALADKHYNQPLPMKTEITEKGKLPQIADYLNANKPSEDCPNATIVDAALFLIMLAESSGKAVGKHPDGISYGYFGLTPIACDEINETYPPIHEYECARKYLNRCFICGDADLFSACGRYHGGHKGRRANYVSKLKAIDPTEYEGAVKTFFRLKGSESSADALSLEELTERIANEL